MTKEEWLSRCAKRYVEKAGMTQSQADMFAEVSTKIYMDDCMPINTEDNRSMNKRFGTEAVCQNLNCGKIFIGFRKKFCSQRCKDLISIEKVRKKRKNMNGI